VTKPNYLSTFLKLIKIDKNSYIFFQLILPINEPNGCFVVVVVGNCVIVVVIVVVVVVDVVAVLVVEVVVVTCSVIQLHNGYPPICSHFHV
jgi:hypothetical protein